MTRSQAVALARGQGLLPGSGDYAVSLVVADKVSEFARRGQCFPGGSSAIEP